MFKFPSKSSRLAHIGNRSFAVQASQSRPIQNYSKKTVTLNDGYEIPIFGFGTWGCDAFDAQVMADSTSYALQTGYRLFDCARVYKNEKELGHVFKDAFANNVTTREEMFIVSKLYNNEHAPPTSNVINACESTLSDLQTDYLDMFMIHWPFANVPNDPNPKPYDINSLFETWKCMNELSDRGLIRSLGMSNFTMKKLDDLRALIDEYNNEINQKELNKNLLRYPTFNQMEIHPYLQVAQKIEHHYNIGVVPSAAMPLGSPERPARWKRDDDPIPLENEVIADVAKELGVSPAQTIIAWHLHRGIVTTPKATVDWMIEQNWKAQDIVLSPEQLDRIASIDLNYMFQRGEAFFWKEGQIYQDLWDGEQ